MLWTAIRALSGPVVIILLECCRKIIKQKIIRTPSTILNTIALTKLNCFSLSFLYSIYKIQRNWAHCIVRPSVFCFTPLSVKEKLLDACMDAQPKAKKGKVFSTIIITSKIHGIFTHKLNFGNLHFVNSVYLISKQGKVKYRNNTFAVTWLYNSVNVNLQTIFFFRISYIFMSPTTHHIASASVDSYNRNSVHYHI